MHFLHGHAAVAGDGDEALARVLDVRLPGDAEEMPGGVLDVAGVVVLMRLELLAAFLELVSVVE